MRKIKCEGCGRRAPSFEIVNYGSMDKGYKQLCYRCFNAEAATPQVSTTSSMWSSNRCG